MNTSIAKPCHATCSHIVTATSKETPAGSAPARMITKCWKGSNVFPKIQKKNITCEVLDIGKSLERLGALLFVARTTSKASVKPTLARRCITIWRVDSNVICGVTVSSDRDIVRRQFSYHCSLCKSRP